MRGLQGGRIEDCLGQIWEAQSCCRSCRSPTVPYPQSRPAIRIDGVNDACRARHLESRDPHAVAVRPRRQHAARRARSATRPLPICWRVTTASRATSCPPSTAGKSTRAMASCCCSSGPSRRFVLRWPIKPGCASSAPRSIRAMASRVGIHLGEVVLRENSPEDVARGAKPLEVEGLAKAIAARVMSLAGRRAHPAHACSLRLRAARRGGDER